MNSLPAAQAKVAGGEKAGIKPPVFTIALGVLLPLFALLDWNNFIKRRAGTIEGARSDELPGFNA